MARGKTKTGPPRRHALHPRRHRPAPAGSSRHRAAKRAAYGSADPQPGPAARTTVFTVRRWAVPAKCCKTRAMSQLSPMYHQLRAHPAIISGESDSRLFYEVKSKRFISLSDN